MAYILLENRKTNSDRANSHYFHGAYRRICCTDPSTAQACLAEIDAAREAGKYLVGYLAYELAYCLHGAVLAKFQSDAKQPLIDFYIFEYYQLLTPVEVDALLVAKSTEDESFIYNAQLNFDKAAYTQSLEQIKQAIVDGETYQVNFTGRYQFNLQGSSVELYKQLRERQRVEFSALFNCDDVQVLSLSPELFFRKQGEVLHSKPMKGTTPRSSDSVIDAKYKQQLVSDPKIVAENMIIVDLIRNDLSQIAKPHSVDVPKLFEIETYETVYQMTSTVACQVESEIKFSQIVRALFPCGSITGAPKVRTMQIIRELEKADRGLYTGAIGYITPDNDMCFSVAIRTLHLNEGAGVMGVGGGIVHDSVIADEYDEMKVKAKFLTGLATPFDLIECFYYDTLSGYRYLEEHMQRLSHSANTFNFAFSKAAIISQLDSLRENLDPVSAYKIKVVLQKTGDFDVFSEKVDQTFLKNKVRLLEQPIATEGNILFQHKTTAKSVREHYNSTLMSENNEGDLFDVIFVNESGYVTEGSKCNLFIQQDGVIFTPPISAGLLPGVMRKKFMEQYPKTQEKLLVPQDLVAAEKIWITNSVVGILEVSLV